MSILISPGNAFMCKINTHREGWAGLICTDAATWNCGARPDFRRDFCAEGEKRCFHLHTFDPGGASLEIDGNGASWLLEKVPDALDDQFLILWGFHAAPPGGIVENVYNQRETRLFGIYRVKSVERGSRGFQTIWTVKPYDDGWVRVDHAGIQRPRFDQLRGSYIVEVESSEVSRLLAEVERSTRPWPDPSLQKRFVSFKASYPKWMRVAEAKMRARRDEEDATRSFMSGDGATTPEVAASAKTPTMSNRPFKELLSDRKTAATSTLEAPAATDGAEAAAATRTETEKVPRPAPVAPGDDRAGTGAGDSGPLIEPSMRPWIRDTFGEDKLFDLEVAASTKSLIIVRGDPGAGKSHLALRLLDDPDRERTLVVPVAATWRGREDLLGYVNPVHGNFERTPFTDFLFEAEAAWKDDDKRARLVVFEEFNLSQPEHWFADILSLSQFESEDDRTIVLAGASTSDERRRRVFLSPAVRFVATINADHTTRPLSQRVLDRAAVVTLETSAKDAFARAGLVLPDKVAGAIKELDFVLRPKGSPFSIRTARAIKDAVRGYPEVDANSIVDTILTQQVLSKVRVMAHDATDASFLDRLSDWATKCDGLLPRCDGVISTWRDMLESGRDVVQG